MPWCRPCDRYFNTDHGYNQHIDNSAFHQSDRMDLEWECEDCGREFCTEQSLHQHCSSAAGHPYCISCKRMFRNENNLTQHLHSRIHVGSAMKCPFCTRSFTTASGITIHLESGNCPSGIDRHQINETIRRLDRQNVITKPMLTTPGYDSNPIETIATERAWNGRAYGCYLCPQQFASLDALNKHFKSPVHEENIYRCPKAGCARTYKLLSGLIQHFESETCGFMKFDNVQRQARNGVENMVGKMIANGR